MVGKIVEIDFEAQFTHPRMSELGYRSFMNDSNGGHERKSQPTAGTLKAAMLSNRASWATSGK